MAICRQNLRPAILFTRERLELGHACVMSVLWTPITTAGEYAGRVSKKEQA